MNIVHAQTLNKYTEKMRDAHRKMKNVYSQNADTHTFKIHLCTGKNFHDKDNIKRISEECKWNGNIHVVLSRYEMDKQHKGSTRKMTQTQSHDIRSSKANEKKKNLKRVGENERTEKTLENRNKKKK